MPTARWAATCARPKAQRSVAQLLEASQASRWIQRHRAQRNEGGGCSPPLRWLPSPPLALRAADPLPPFTVGYEPTNVDERGLWMDSDNRERQIRDSKLTVHDEELNRYLTGMLCRTVGAERCQGDAHICHASPGF